MQKNNQRPRKIVKRKQDSLFDSLFKSKNRYSIYQSNIRNSEQRDIFRTVNRQSLQINNTQPVRILNTISQITKPVHQKISSNKKNIISLKRYDEKDIEIKYKESPYDKVKYGHNQKDLLGKSLILDRSNIKIKSGSLTKQLPSYQLYKQPRSTLSQHYDPSLDKSLHKRRQSVIDQSQVLKIAKEFYKDNHFDKCSDYIKKFLRNNPNYSAQIQYMLGMSLINKSQLEQGIQVLQKTIKLDPYYKKTIYLILALAYKRLSKHLQAIDILGKGIILYPDYYDCRVYRGKMYLKQQMYSQAKNDFTKAIQLDSQKGFAYLGKGTCQIHLKLINDALKTFTAGIQTDLAHVCYQKRGICLYEQQKYDKSLQDLQQASLYDNYYSSSLHYYKGMIYYKRKVFTEALLSFQESLKYDNNKQIVTLATQMMLKIKIQDKDFYEASHIINRTQNIDIDFKVIQQWKLFLEGSLFLMKKKYKQGLDTYEILEQKQLYKKNYKDIKNDNQKERFKFLKPLIHLYKAFGYLAENTPEKALLEYQHHTEICCSMSISSQNLSKRYNTLIVNAIKNYPKSAINSFIQSKQLIPTKPEPYLFISFDLLSKMILQNMMHQKETILDEIIQNITIGISHLPQLSNNHISSFYYYRSIIYLYRQQYHLSVGDIDKAIEKSQDNIPKYFYLRGLIFACFGNFSQAIQDLTVAINLDQKYAKPYLERVKCLQIQGSSNQAFIDLQKYIILAPDDPYIHKYAGFLLFQNCSYKDCLSAFAHGPGLENDCSLVLTKAKCYFLLGQFDKSIQFFQKYQNLSNSDLFKSDIDIINICKSIKSDQKHQQLTLFLQQLTNIIQEITIDQQEGTIFKLRDMYQIKGSIYLLLSQYDQALQSFNEALNLFHIQKQKQSEKHFIEDPLQIQQQWSEIELKFNISLCHLCKKQYEIALKMLTQYSQSSEKGKNWDSYISLISQLFTEDSLNIQIALDTFEQNHRMSKNWPKLTLPDTKISLSLAFSYPFVSPPEMLPEFQVSLFLQFDPSKIQPKPEAPWINRNFCGLVFTPNIQTFDNLELSITTKKKEDDSDNIPDSQISESQNQSFQKQNLKQKFKLGTQVEIKLNRIIKK